MKKNHSFTFPFSPFAPLTLTPNPKRHISYLSKFLLMYGTSSTSFPLPRVLFLYFLVLSPFSRRTERARGRGIERTKSERLAMILDLLTRKQQASRQPRTTNSNTHNSFVDIRGRVSHQISPFYTNVHSPLFAPSKNMSQCSSTHVQAVQ